MQTAKIVTIEGKPIRRQLIPAGDLEQCFGAAVLDGGGFPFLGVAVGMVHAPELIGDVIDRVLHDGLVIGRPLAEGGSHAVVATEERQALPGP